MRTSLVAVALSLATAVLAPASEALAGFDPAAIYQVPAEGAPTSGAERAPITIVEFSDYACQYCIHARATMAALELLYPGQLRWVHRSVPYISATTLGAEAAHAAAAQGQHRAMEAQLYAAGGRYDRVGVELFAQALGLDMIRFRAALDSGSERAAVAADVALARGLGVTATPTFFVNGRAVVGSQPVAQFAAVIDEELARAAVAEEASGLRGAALYARLVADGRAAADPGPSELPPRRELASLTPYRVGLGLPGAQLGPDAAPVTLVVFSDFQCPFCVRNQPALIHARRVFGDSLRVVFRHLPLPIHRDAQVAAEASMEAAAQGKFWAFHDRLFAAPGPLDRATLEAHATAVGLAMGPFTAALDAHRHRDAVRLDAAGGMALGVDGTPTMFINGLMLAGAYTAPRLEQAIRVQLEQAQQMIAGGVEPGDVYAVSISSAEGQERADPSSVPVPRAARLLQGTPRERLQSVLAACRRHAQPSESIGPLPAPLDELARGLCANYGVTLR
ncbi:MAG: thioredoxin domain-containing protein [Kofleriaceae bacterium]